MEIMVCAGCLMFGIMLLRVFFTLWRVIDKRLHPEKLEAAKDTPEVAFKGLRKKVVDVQMKDGTLLRHHKYVKTILFGDSDFSICALVYYELQSPKGNGVFICGSDILKIETCRGV